jgi:hypothetical protein
MATENRSEKFKRMAHLEIGDNLIFGDTKWEVLGYVLYSESDSEDTWYWEEWFLLSSKGYGYLQLDGDENTFTFYETKVDISIPLKDDYRKGGWIELGSDEKFKVVEKGIGTALTVYGEIPWMIGKGYKIKYYDGKNDSVQYSLEISQSEVEVYKGRMISHEDLYSALEDKSVIAIFKNKAKEGSFLKKIAVVFGGFGIFALFLALIASALFGRETYSQLVAVRSDGIYLCEDFGESCLKSELPLGPFTLDKVGRPHTIEIESFTTTSANWTYVTVELLDENQEVINGFAGDFWVDDGETSNTASYTFRLTDGGEFYIDLEREPDPVNSVRTPNHADSYEIKVSEGGILSRYYIIFAVVLCIIGFLTFSRSSTMMKAKFHRGRK